MEIKTRLDENKKNDLSSGDQRSGDFGVRAIRFVHGPVETTGIGENELAQACFYGRGLQLHRQTENSERHHTQAQTQVLNTRIDHEEAKTEMVPIDAYTSRSSFHLFGNALWIFRLGKDRRFRTGRLSHSSCSACFQTTCWRSDEIPSFLAGFCVGMDSNFSQSRFLERFGVQCLEGVDSSVCEVLPVSAEAFFEDVQGSNLLQCPECKARCSTGVGMFLHRTKVHSYKSPQIVYFKGNTCPQCKSLFAAEKSANDHHRRNLKRKFCARPRGPDASNVPPRRVAPPPKNRGKRGKGFLTQQTLFGVFGFEAQGDRGQKRGLACSGMGAGARGGRGAGSKSLPKPEPRKRQTSSHGSKKSDIGSWFTKRAFSNQSGQGGPAATDHHRETGQAPRHCEQAIHHQTKGNVGANAQNAHEPGTSSHGDWSVRVVQDQEIWDVFAQSHNPNVEPAPPGLGLHSYGALVRRSEDAGRAAAQRTTTGESTSVGAHRAMRLLRSPQCADNSFFCFNPNCRRLPQHCHLQRPIFSTFMSCTDLSVTTPCLDQTSMSVT